MGSGGWGGWWLLFGLSLAALLSRGEGLRCHGDVGVDECKDVEGGFRGRLTYLMYHPSKRVHPQLVCARALVKDRRDGGWRSMRGCAKRSLSPPDFQQDGADCFYNSEEQYYDWYVTCVCTTDMCNGPNLAQAAMVPEQRFHDNGQDSTSERVETVAGVESEPQATPHSIAYRPLPAQPEEEKEEAMKEKEAMETDEAEPEAEDVEEVFYSMNEEGLASARVESRFITEAPTSAPPQSEAEPEAEPEQESVEPAMELESASETESEPASATQSPSEELEDYYEEDVGLLDTAAAASVPSISLFSLLFSAFLAAFFAPLLSRHP